MQGEIIKFTPNPTHHYVAMSLDTYVAIDKDDSGRVRVFLNRDACEAAYRTKHPDKGRIGIVGMGDEKWALFQKEVPHVVVEVADAR